MAIVSRRIAKPFPGKSDVVLSRVSRFRDLVIKAFITKSLNLETLDKTTSDLPGNGFAILLDTIAIFFSSVRLKSLILIFKIGINQCNKLY